MCQQHQVILILKANYKEADDEHVENEEEEGEEEEGDEEIESESDVCWAAIEVVHGMTQEQVIMAIPHLKALFQCHLDGQAEEAQVEKARWEEDTCPSSWKNDMDEF